MVVNRENNFERNYFLNNNPWNACGTTYHCKLMSQPSLETPERGTQDVGIRNNKRRVPSPIHPGQDYSVILRKQEQSASPALKKHKRLPSEAFNDSSDEEFVFTGIKKKKPSMPKENTRGENEENMDTGCANEDQPSFSFADFKRYSTGSVKTSE